MVLLDWHETLGSNMKRSPVVSLKASQLCSKNRKQFNHGKKTDLVKA